LECLFKITEKWAKGPCHSDPAKAGENLLFNYPITKSLNYPIGLILSGAIAEPQAQALK
jgi:hypothetical protein